MFNVDIDRSVRNMERYGKRAIEMVNGDNGIMKMAGSRASLGIGYVETKPKKRVKRKRSNKENTTKINFFINLFYRVKLWISKIF